MAIINRKIHLLGTIEVIFSEQTSNDDIFLAINDGNFFKNVRLILFHQVNQVTDTIPNIDYRIKSTEFFVFLFFTNHDL